MQNDKKSEMTEERIQLLDAVGFTWSLRERSTNPWEDGLRSLEEFKGKHHHIKVPNNYRGNLVLGRWVKKIRSDYEKMKAGEPSSLDDQRVTILGEMGFEFDASRCEPIKEGRKNKAEKKRSTSDEDRSDLDGVEDEQKVKARKDESGMQQKAKTKKEGTNPHPPSASRPISIAPWPVSAGTQPAKEVSKTTSKDSRAKGKCQQKEKNGGGRSRKGALKEGGETVSL